jgi:hypothetical protein
LPVKAALIFCKNPGLFGDLGVVGDFDLDLDFSLDGPDPPELEEDPRLSFSFLLFFELFVYVDGGLGEVGVGLGLELGVGIFSGRFSKSLELDDLDKIPRPLSMLWPLEDVVGGGATSTLLLRRTGSCGVISTLDLRLKLLGLFKLLADSGAGIGAGGDWNDG